MSSVEGFHKTGYAIRQNGQPMPVQFVRIDDDGRAEVLGPNLKVYTFNRDALATTAEVERQIAADKASLVANSYSFRDVPGMPARTVVCSHPTKASSSYVIVESAGGMVCTCPSFAKSEFATCKHIEGLQAKEDSAARTAKRLADEEIALGLIRAEVARRVAEKDFTPRPPVGAVSNYHEFCSAENW